MFGSLLVVLAGVMGALGVGLAAAAAHIASDTALGPGAVMLLVHSAAVTAIAAARQSRVVAPRLAGAGALGLALGAALFAGDIALRVFAERRLFPMAAPTGGILMLVSWLAVAFAGLFRPR